MSEMPNRGKLKVHFLPVATYNLCPRKSLSMMLVKGHIYIPVFICNWTLFVQVELGQNLFLHLSPQIDDIVQSLCTHLKMWYMPKSVVNFPCSSNHRGHIF
jgi:hypothetical protein